MAQLASRGYLVRLTGGMLGNYTAFSVEGEPNLYIVEHLNGAYWPNPSYGNDFVILDESTPSGDHGVQYPGFVEGGSSDIDVVALWMPSLAIQSQLATRWQASRSPTRTT